MPDGEVEYVVKFAVTLSSNMELRSFPFDSQDLEIYVHPFAGDVERIVLTVRAPRPAVRTGSACLPGTLAGSRPA